MNCCTSYSRRNFLVWVDWSGKNVFVENCKESKLRDTIKIQIKCSNRNTSCKFWSISREAPYWSSFWNKRSVRSSHKEWHKGFLQNYSEKIPQILPKNTCSGDFFNQLTAFRPAVLFKRLWHRCLLVNFAKFLRKAFL